jgi:hypothetical protein
MHELFLKFIKSPNRESYMAIRTALISSEQYSPYSNEMESIDELLDAGKLEEAREKLSSSIPNLLLSPRAYMMFSFIEEKLQNEENAEAERYIAATCCEGILATGDGTESNPYIVVRPSDEYDVIQYLGKQVIGQSLIKDSEHSFDLIDCDDGSKLWFDVTDAINKVQDV